MHGTMLLRAERSPEEVYDFIADLRNETLWNPRVERIDLVGPGPVATGATFRGRYRGLGALDTTLVECDRPRRIAFRSQGSRADIDGVFELTPVGDATEVRLEADVAPRGVLALLAPVMAPVFRRQNAAAADRLRTALDGAARR